MTGGTRSRSGRSRGWTPRGSTRAALPALSRYMGHCGPKETEWYLRLTDEGRAGVLERMELYAPHVAPGLGGV